MNILSRLLAKRGIKDKQELTPEERSDFERWHDILSKDKVSIDDVAEFCAYQINVIEAQFKDLERSKDKTDRLVLLHSVYSSIKSFITKPIAEREALIRHLTDLL